MTPPRYVLARRPGMQLDVFATRCGLHPDMVRRLVALGLVRCHVDARGEPWFEPSALAVVARIQRLRAGLGLNYADHAAEGGFKPPSYPTIFARFASSLVGHGAPLIRPRVSTQFDYEGELVAVVGRGGRHISREAALDHIFRVVSNYYCRNSQK